MITIIGTEATRARNTVITPLQFRGIGYAKAHNSLPLEEILVPTPLPAAGQVLIQVTSSSLNALEYKLALLNFFGRTPPVILGFDLAGVVIALGEGVQNFVEGDEVVALADSTGDGGWATGGAGGYALAREYLTVRKPKAVSFEDAGVLPICFLAAYVSLSPHLKPGNSLYVPGGAGGVGHLAIQMAANVLGASLIISSAGKKETTELARAHGADEVFNYHERRPAEMVAHYTNGAGVDVVFDATYNEESFEESASAVKAGGKCIVLGVGPGKTNRIVDTTSPVEAILLHRQAELVSANMLTHFTSEAARTPQAKALLQAGLQSAMEWTVAGKVRPHIGRTILSTVSAINHELGEMREGRGVPGKVAVRVAY